MHSWSHRPRKSNAFTRARESLLSLIAGGLPTNETEGV